jgi:hypothetical protein
MLYTRGTNEESLGQRGKRDNIYITYLLEKFNYASRERRVATRVELELVGLRVKAMKIHEQRVFFAIVGHFSIMIK